MTVVATIAVVILHVAASGVVQFGSIQTVDWWVYNIADSACRWAVPVFVMLSGAKLLDAHKLESVKGFYTRRLSRIGIPLVFWSLFYLGWQVIYRHYESPMGLLKQLALGNPYYHLYFLYVIAGLYLFTPAFRVLLSRLDSEVRPLTLAFFLLASFDAFVRRMTGYEYSAFLKFVPFIGYYCAGYLIRDVALSRKALVSDDTIN